jgi:hypothetical protein
MHADQLKKVTHSYCRFLTHPPNKVTRRFSDMTPNGRYPNVYRPGRAFWHHSEDKLLGTEPNVKRDVRIFGDCGDSL